MPPKEIHEGFIETLGKESHYSTVKNGQQRGGERALRMIDGLAAPKMPPLMKMSSSCTPWLCVIGGLRSMPSEVGISFGAVSTIIPNLHLRYVKGCREC